MTNTRQSKIAQSLMEFYQKPVAKVSLELFFSVAAVILFAFFAIRPTLVTMSNLIKEIQDKTALNDKLQQKAAALSSAQQAYAQALPLLPALDEAIPSTPNFYTAIVILEKLASERGLTITDMQAKQLPPETAADLTQPLTRVSRPLTVTVTGDYPSIRQYIDDIHNIRRTMTVDGIIFSLQDDRGKKRLSCQISLSVSYFGLAPKIVTPGAQQSILNTSPGVK